MRVFNNKIELSAYISEVTSEGETLGFVPTMGALHHGHLSLVNFGLEDNDFVVVTEFLYCVIICMTD